MAMDDIAFKIIKTLYIWNKWPIKDSISYNESLDYDLFGLFILIYPLYIEMLLLQVSLC